MNLNNKKIVWAGRILTVVVSLFFGFNALVKLFPETFYPPLVEQMAAIGLPQSILMKTAILEILCVVVYLIPKTSVLGAVLFTGYLGGAILAHLRVDQPVFIHIIFGGLIWLGVYVREPRLRNILPLRKW